jgi:hypothetical protein
VQALIAPRFADVSQWGPTPGKESRRREESPDIGGLKGLMAGGTK